MSDLPVPTPKLSDADLRLLDEAREALEDPGLAARLSEYVGMPVERAMGMLPEPATEAINSAVTRALQKSLDAAVRTLGNDRLPPRNFAHKLAAGLTGAAGGAFGLPAVALELPLSTMLILRSIADIARSEGEDLSDIMTRLACLEVFALGGGYGAGKARDATDVGYFAVRAGLAKHVRDAAKYLSTHGVHDATAPPLLRLISEIAKRFGVVVSEKVAAQAVPVIGAAGGALLNTFFIDHYQDIARAHFTIRRLERTYGHEIVRDAYQSLPRD